MSSTILLIVLLSAHITGLISEQLLKATVGGSVLFPCSLPRYPPTFYWQDGERNVLFHWKDGDEIKEPNKYKNRSEIFRSEFSSGNFSFRLDNISPEDNNTTFFAYVKLDKQKLSEERCRSRLQVSAPYQHLVLTVNHTTNSATCSARGGYPAAQVSWKGLNRSSDEQQDLQDAETSPQEDPTEKTFSFTSSVNVTGLKSVTCIVYNRHSHESITETIKIPDPQNPTSSVSTPGENKRINVAAIAVPVVLVILVIAGVYIYLRYRSQPQDPDLPNQSPIELHPQDRAQAEDQDQARAPDPPSEPPVEHDPHDGAQAEAEAADAPGETASLTGTPVGIRHRTKSNEDAAASPEKENLLK